MPFGDEKVGEAIGLALSGGGFRATLFHLGALWRLNELGYLSKINRVASVSGGSIVAAYLGLNWNRLAFSNGVITNFVDDIILPLRGFCSRHIEVIALLSGLLRPWRLRRPGNLLETAYRRHLFGEATLQDLPDVPRFVIQSTHILTGVGFRFSRPYAGEYRIGLIRQPSFRISECVAASSAFPPFFSPFALTLPRPGLERTEGADLYAYFQDARKVYLTDAGVLDNLGLDAIWNRYKTVLISDAGAVKRFSRPRWRDTLWIVLAARALILSTSQAGPLQRRAIVGGFKEGTRSGTIWRSGWIDLDTYGIEDHLPYDKELARDLATLRTRLNPFSEQEQGQLINWGYAVCDAAMRRHIITGPVPPPAWPVPAYALEL